MGYQHVLVQLVWKTSAAIVVIFDGSISSPIPWFEHFKVSTFTWVITDRTVQSRWCTVLRYIWYILHHWSSCPLVLVLMFFQDHQVVCLLLWMEIYDQFQYQATPTTYFYSTTLKSIKDMSPSIKRNPAFLKKFFFLSGILPFLHFCGSAANILCFTAAACEVRLPLYNFLNNTNNNSS